MTNSNLKKAFTTIEVILVLAIAGLIFMAVFLALPAMQRSERNTQRKNDIARAATMYEQYRTNNGCLFNCIPEITVDDYNTNLAPSLNTEYLISKSSCDPAAPKGFCKDYMLSGGYIEFSDPNGQPYIFFEFPNLTLINEHGVTPQQEGDMTNKVDNKIYISPNTKCEGGKVVPIDKLQPDDMRVSFNSSDPTVYVLNFSMQYKLEGGGWLCVNR